MTPLVPVGTAALGPLTLRVDSATLSFDASVDSPVRWSIQVKTGKVRFDDEDWSLCFYGDDVPVPGSALPLQAGSVFHPDPVNERGEPHFRMYVWEHETSYDVRLAVLRTAPDGIRLRITGTCDVGWSAEIGERVPFEIHAELALRPSRQPPTLVIRRKR